MVAGAPAPLGEGGAAGAVGLACMGMARWATCWAAALPYCWPGTVAIGSGAAAPVRSVLFWYAVPTAPMRLPPLPVRGTYLRFFPLERRWTLRAMAMACFCGRPAFISVLMFWLTAFFDPDLFSGIRPPLR